MMTRARKALIVVGNKNTLLSDRVWRDWIEWCEKNNLIVQASHTDSNINRKISQVINIDREYEEDDMENE
jgi:superfamily I DNA and/or RNA helicase